MGGEAVVEDVVSSLLNDEGDEGEIFLRLRFGEGEDFHFSPIIVRVSHEVPKYVQCRVVAYDIALKV